MTEFTSITERLRILARNQGSRTAIVHPMIGDSVLATSFDELLLLSRCFSAFIRETGPSSEIIPLYLAKSAESIAAMLGCLIANKKFAVLNRKFRIPQIEQVLEQSRASVLVTDGPGIMTLRRELSGSRLLQTAQLVVLKDGRFGNTHQKVLADLAEHANIQVLDLKKVSVLDAAPDEFEPKTASGCCLFTSGSTGNPKGVLIEETDLALRAEAEVRWFGLKPHDVLLSVLPFSFDVGLNQLLSALEVGASLVLLDSWLPADIIVAAERFGVTGISGVPSLWRDLLKTDLAFDNVSAHAALRYISVSGGSLAPAQLDELSGRLGSAGIFKTYGQTEAFRSTSLRPEDFKRFSGSVGRAFEGVHLYVVDENLTPVPNGEIGQVFHTGLGSMLGYLTGEDHEKIVQNPFFGADNPHRLGVLTGDFGYLDAAGYLYLKGRVDEMLKISGNRVYPAEVREQISALETVTDAEVVDFCDESGETRLVAFVVVLDSETRDIGQIQRALAKLLPSYMMPSFFILVESLPLTESGKPDRQSLKQLAAQSIGTRG